MILVYTHEERGTCSMIHWVCQTISSAMVPVGLNLTDLTLRLSACASGSALTSIKCHRPFKGSCHMLPWVIVETKPCAGHLQSNQFSEACPPAVRRSHHNLSWHCTCGEKPWPLMRWEWNIYIHRTCPDRYGHFFAQILHTPPWYER